MAQFINANARAVILDRLLTLEGTASQHRNYYIDTQIRLVGERLPKPAPAHLLDRKSVFVFADDQPLYNWEHPCRYLLVDATSLQFYQPLPGRLPPYFFTNRPDSYHVLKKSVHFPQPVLYAPFLLTATHTRSPGNRYAIFYSSCSDVCHFNDMAFLHQTLVQKYGYSAANIIVLNYDGLSKHRIGEGTLTFYADEMEMTGAATKTNLAKAISDLPLTTNDSLLIYTSNHGSWHATDGSAVLGYSDSLEKVFATDLAKMIHNIPVKLRELIVIGQQCFSGGFLAPIAAEVNAADSICVISSCQADKEAIRDIQHNPFSLHFISALAMRTPDGVPLGTGPSNPDTNNDGNVSLREAFTFAYDRVSSSYGNYPLIHPTTGGAGDIVLGEKTLLFPEELPELEPLIREKWKAFDPAFDKQLREKLVKLKKIQKRMHDEQEKARSKALDAVEALLDK
jgi:hypothetical protein